MKFLLGLTLTFSVSANAFVCNATKVTVQGADTIEQESRLKMTFSSRTTLKFETEIDEAAYSATYGLSEEVTVRINLGPDYRHGAINKSTITSNGEISAFLVDGNVSYGIHCR